MNLFLRMVLFAIHPKLQGAQIGPRFMAYVEQQAFQRVSSIILKVITLFQEKLIGFYIRLGYRMTEETLAFPEDDKKTYILPEYQDQIVFSILRKDRPPIRSAL